MAGVVNFGELFVADCRQSLLFVGTLGMAALFAIDDQNRALDAEEKLHGLS